MKYRVCVTAHPFFLTAPNLNSVTLKFKTMNAECEKIKKEIEEVKALIDKETNPLIERALCLLHNQMGEELLDSVYWMMQEQGE